MGIQEIKYETAKEFIKNWHYLKNIPKSTRFCYGWYIENKLYAVASYGVPSNRNIYNFISRQINETVNKDNLLELSRLCRTEPQQKYLSQFLSNIHKDLKQKGIKYIISYSDPNYKFTGSLYKACNFTYLGKTDKQYVIKEIESNKYIHKRTVTNHAKYNNLTFEEALVDLNLERDYILPRDRWFIKL